MVDDKLKNNIDSFKYLLFGTRFVSVILSLLLFPFLTDNFSNLYFYISFILILSFNIYITWKPEYYLESKHNLIFLFDFILALAALSVTGSGSSPFVFYFISVILSVPFLFTPSKSFLFSFLALSILFSFVVISQQLTPSVSFALASALLAISVFTFLLSSAIQNYFKSKTAPPPPKIEMKEVKSTTPDKEYIQRLFSLMDLQQELQTNYSLNQCYKAFLNFIDTFKNINSSVVFFKNTETIHKVSLDSGKLNKQNVSHLYEKYESSLPDELEIEEKYILFSDSPEVSIYLPDFKEENPFEYGIIKLSTDLLAYRTGEIHLEENEKKLLTSFSSLYEAARNVTRDVKERPILLAAAKAIKNLTGMQKSITVATQYPDKIDLESPKCIIKGRLSEHPESIWREPFYKAAKECYEHKKSIIVSLADGSTTLLCSPLLFRDKVYGVAAGVTSLSREEVKRDIRTLEIISSIASTSLANIELLKQREDFAVSMERDRIARDMHDSLVQSLFSMLILIETSKREIETNPKSAANKLEELKSNLQTTIKETREYIYELYPHAVTDIGLKSAIQRVISTLSSSGVEFEYEIEDLPGNIPLKIENSALRIVQEAVTNAIKHGESQKVSIEVNFEDSLLKIVIKDNGKGFDPDEVNKKIRDGKHIGIKSMVERARQVGGSIKLSSSPRKGTIVKATLPLG